MSLLLSLCHRYLPALISVNLERALALLALLALLGLIEVPLMGESDVRIRQAVRWAVVLGVSAEDLLPQIPEIPKTLLLPRGELNLLVLVPFHLGNIQLTEAAGMKYKEYGADDALVLVNDPRYANLPKTWAWVIAHDGTPNLGRMPSECLAECSGDLYGGVDKVGLAILVQHGPRKYVMDLPASVRADSRDCFVCVDPSDGVRSLFLDRYDGASPFYGTLVFALR